MKLYGGYGKSQTNVPKSKTSTSKSKHSVRKSRTNVKINIPYIKINKKFLTVVTILAVLIVFMIVMFSSCNKSSVATAEIAATQSDNEYVLSFIGDCTLASCQYNDDFDIKLNNDYSYPFKNTVKYFKNDDLTVANLECTLSDFSMTPAEGGVFAFQAPTKYANILVKGNVDFVTTANNHMNDFYERGITDTSDTLDEYKIDHAGENETYIYDMDGIKVGFYCLFNNLEPTKKLVEAGVEKLKDDGAEYIICALHWGVEGSYTVTESQEEVGKAAIDAGADIVYGSHPHVLQKIEKYNDGYILYSMGNWSFGGNTNPRDRDTAIVQVTITVDNDGNITTDGYKAIPCCLSSTSGVNDYCPEPYKKGTDEYERTMSKLDGTYDGDDLVVDYSGVQ